MSYFLRLSVVTLLVAMAEPLIRRMCIDRSPRVNAGSTVGEGCLALESSSFCGFLLPADTISTEWAARSSASSTVDTDTDFPLSSRAST